MTEFENLSRDELQRQLRTSVLHLREKHSGEFEDIRLAHELNVYQIELEIQNRELHEKQRELEVALNKYADLYDSAPIGYITLDKKGNILDCNITTARILSQPRSQLINTPFQMFLDGGSRHEFIRDLQKTLQNGIETSLDLRLVKAVQSMRYIHLRLICTSNIGGETEVRGTFFDISEKKQTELQLHESEVRYRSLVELSPNAVVVHDLKGRIVFANHATVHMLNAVSIKQLIGASVIKFVHPDFRQKTINVMKALLKNRKPVTMLEQKLVTLTGKEISVEVSGGVLDYNGKPAIQVVVLDITGRKHAIEKTLELLQQNRTLTKRMFQLQEEERQRLSRELHDEFGQWLTAIQLDTQNIFNLIGSRFPKVKTSIASINFSTIQIQKNVRRMNRSLRPELLDELGLPSSLQGLVNQWQKHNPHTKCQLHIVNESYEVEKDLAITVFRIVQESLTNVSKHARASKVEVRLQPLDFENAKRNALLLTIEDNGIGLPENAPALGFGLIGMRERVQAQGGNFHIDSHYCGEYLDQERTGLRIVAEFPGHA